MDSLEIQERDRPVIEVTPAMVDAGVKVFCKNSWGMPITEFTVAEIRDILPEALREAMRAAPPFG